MEIVTCGSRESIPCWCKWHQQALQSGFIANSTSFSLLILILYSLLREDDVILTHALKIHILAKYFQKVYFEENIGECLVRQPNHC